MQGEQKLIIVGNNGVGKTCFVKKAFCGKFETGYKATLGFEIIPVGNYSCWDTAGNENYGGLRDGYYIGANAAIIMFDVTSRVSFKSVSFWYKSIRGVCPDIPIVLCGNKVDCKDHKAIDLGRFINKGIQYYDISTKSNHKLMDPFLYISCGLLGDNLNFVESPAILPPEVKLPYNEFSNWIDDECGCVDEIESLNDRVQQLEMKQDDLIEYWEKHGKSAEEILNRIKKVEKMENCGVDEVLYCWIVIISTHTGESQRAICDSEKVAINHMIDLAYNILPGTMTGFVYVKKVPKNVLIIDNESDIAKVTINY